MTKIATWNVNGLRAVLAKDALTWIHDFDIIGLQESKLSFNLADNLLGYQAYYSLAQKKGYSGVVVLTKQLPREIENCFSTTNYKDNEGRILKLNYENFLLYNIYFPNGKKDSLRLNFKLDFYHHFLEEMQNVLKNQQKIIVMGDFNTAHQPIDLARPKENESISGFLPQERQLIDEIINLGFIDCFRYFTSDPNWYTWWHLRTGARKRNSGWRIDYLMVSQALTSQLKNSTIHNNILGSDHCPVSISLTS